MLPDEISRNLADRYLGKVTQQQLQKHGMQPNMYDKLPKNRQQGVSNAFKRVLVKSPVKEETIEVDKNGLDEVASYKTLQQRYSNVEQKYGDESKKDYPSVKGRSVMKKIARTAYKQHGMFLQKNEETEQIDELSKSEEITKIVQLSKKP